MLKMIIKHGPLKLKDAFKLCCPNVTYRVDNARRKFLQMPVAAIGVGSKSIGTFCYYLVEKQNTESYSIFQLLLRKAHASKCMSDPAISREQMKQLLYIANDDSQHECLKVAVAKASGRSATKTKSFYRFEMSEKRKQRGLMRQKKLKP